MKALLLTEPMPAKAFIAAIAPRAPELELVEYRPGLGDAELADIDIAFGWRMPEGLAARLPRLRWVCSIAAGVEKLLQPGLAPPDADTLDPGCVRNATGSAASGVW